MNLSELSIRRPIFILCLFLVVIAVGVLSLRRMPVDLFPDVTFPVVVVTTPYPGAGPLEIESLISKPMEDELSALSGVKNIRSINKEGISFVVIEFQFDVDIKFAEQQVRDRVSIVKSKLPDAAEDSTIRRVDPADQPVMDIAIKADLSPSQLYDLADQVIRPRIQQVNQVGLVAIVGGQKREIRIELNSDKLKEYQISAGQVSARLANAGENIPSGSVKLGASQLVYRTLAEFRNTKDIEDVIIRFFANDRPVRIKDLGEVKDDLQEEKSRAFINGTRSMVLQVFKQSGSNTVAVVEDLYKKVNEINADYQGKAGGIELTVVRDNARYITANITDVEETIAIGIFLVALVVLLFLGNFRSTFITALALPNSLLGAFIFMSFLGFSINIMTLLAMVLVVGLLIDDAIVVRENIFRHLERGVAPREAAIKGTQEVLLAVIATTLTVIAVFGPIGFLEGQVGQFFKEFGITVCLVMLISLFDAVTMAPMLSAYFATGVHGPRSAFYEKTFGRVFKAVDRFQERMENSYERLLRLIVVRPSWILISALLIFVLSIGLTTFIPKTFLPPQDSGEFLVTLEMPAGTSLEGTAAVSKQVDEILRSNKEIKQVVQVVGNKDGEIELSALFVQLVPFANRNLNTTDMKEKVREQLKPLAYANPIVGDINAIGTRERPFMLTIAGPDLKEVDAIAQELFKRLKSHPSLKDVDTSNKEGKPEVQFTIDPDKAHEFGVSTHLAGLELRTLIEGTTPAVFRQNGLEYDIRVRLKEDQRNLKDRFNEVMVPNINERLIPLRQIAKPRETQGPAEINRENRNRYISVEGDIAPDGPGMGGAIDEVTRIFKEEVTLPAGMTYKFVGQAENFKELIVNMAIALILGILFIYMVLASLYESFITPFTIMLVLPLAICGAFFSLFISGKSLDLFSMIGCILLMGVATKNSILLVDYANQKILDGMDRTLAIIEAGKVRLRPILMTSLALIVGMIPIAIGLNEASRERTSMGIAILGGLFSSTFLTLLVIPAAFCQLDRFRVWVEEGFKKFVGITSQK